MKGWLVVTTIAVVLGCGGGGGRPGPTGGSGSVDLLDVQAAVFTPSCAVTGCHVGAGAPFGLDLSAGEAWGNVVGVASAESPGFDRVEPFDAGNSYLFMKVTGDPRIQGDPMPALGPPLGADKIALLADWIEQGASR